MQLNWLYFCGICHMMPLKVWPNTAIGCNHQSILACPSYSLYVHLLWYPMYYPEGRKARVSPVQWSKPYSILAPTQDSNPGGRIQNHKRWPLHYHCTPYQLILSMLVHLEFLFENLIHMICRVFVGAVGLRRFPRNLIRQYHFIHYLLPMQWFYFSFL